MSKPHNSFFYEADFNWAYWGSDSKVNIIIIQQRVHVDIIAEMYRICIEIKYIDANFLICVHMILYYFIVIAHVLNMFYVGFAAHCFKEIYTNFSALVQCFNMCKKSKSKECFFHVYLNYPCPIDISILNCTLTAKFVKCYALKYWCPLIINNGILVLSNQALFMYTLTSLPFISFTTCTNGLIFITLYPIIYHSYRINANNCNLFLVLSENVKVIYSITTSM